MEKGEEEVKEVIQYVAEDGNIFSTKEDCMKYEERQGQLNEYSIKMTYRKIAPITSSLEDAMVEGFRRFKQMPTIDGYVCSVDVYRTNQLTQIEELVEHYFK